MSLIGNLNAPTAKTINIAALACDSSVNPDCKSSAEIKEFLKNKYFFLVFNTKLFNAEGFDDNMFTEVSVIQKIPITL